MAGGYPFSEFPGRGCLSPGAPEWSPWLLPTCLLAGGPFPAAGPAWQGGCSFNQPSCRSPWREKLQVATRNFPGFSLSINFSLQNGGFLLSRELAAERSSSGPAMLSAQSGGGSGGEWAHTVCRAPLAEARGLFCVQIGLPSPTRPGKLLGSPCAHCSISGGERR